MQVGIIWSLQRLDEKRKAAQAKGGVLGEVRLELAKAGTVSQDRSCLYSVRDVY